jgi:hypothetical protein
MQWQNNGGRIELSVDDIFEAAECARLRMEDSSGRIKNYNQTDSKDPVYNLEKELMGAMAEMAFCRLIGVEFPKSVGTFKREPDVPPDWEVRWAKRRQASGYQLVVRPGDNPDRKYVLITGSGGVYRCRGWISKRDAKRVGKWLNPPMWTVLRDDDGKPVLDKFGKQRWVNNPRNRWSWFVSEDLLTKEIECDDGTIRCQV